MRSSIIEIALVLGLIASVFGCNGDTRYVGDGGLYQVALTTSTPAAFTSMRDMIYIVEQRVELPVRKPSPTELDDLQKAAGRFGKLPFSRLPWVARGDIELEVDFTLSNLDAQTHEVTVIANGFDEFYEYQPGVTTADDQAIPDYAEWERLYKLEPKQRITRTIREEELDEAAVDLATVVNGAPNANEVMFFENKSATDPRSKPYIPAVIPGLMGLRIGLRATALGRVVLEASVRARDVGSKLADSGQPLFQVHPQLFTPAPVMQ
jgi:hypothetical protein